MSLAVLVTLTAGLLLAAPGAASAQGVTWSGDAETGDKSQWACEALNPGLVTVSAARRLTGRYAYRFENRDGLGTRWGGERQELGQGNCVNGEPSAGGARKIREGDERWIAFAVRLDESFPLSESRPGAYWSALWQTHTDGCGWPLFAVGVEKGVFNSALHFSHNLPNRSTCGGRKVGTYRLSAGPAAKGTWQKVTVHAKFSSDPSKGFYEVWHRADNGPQRKMVKKTFSQTMIPGVEAHQRIGYYRSEDFTQPGAVYHDGFTEARSKSAAERRAFGSR